MRGESTFIDAYSGDYVPEGAPADYQRKPALLTRCILRVRTRRGEWWRDPEFGSRLHLLIREKDLDRVFGLAERYGRECLQPELDSGAASALTVRAERLRPGLLALRITITDAGLKRYGFDYYVRTK